MSHASLGLLETMLNGALALDPEAAQILAPIDGKSLAIELEGVALRVVVLIERGQIRLDAQMPADTCVRGRPEALWMLANARRQGQAGPREGVRISGDIHLLEQFEAAATALRIDLEEPLARCFGDPFAVAAVGGMRRLAASLGESARAFGGNLLDYARYESDWLVDPEPVEDFADGVDRIRDDVERLDKRISILESKIDKRDRATSQHEASADKQRCDGEDVAGQQQEERF